MLKDMNILRIYRTRRLEGSIELTTFTLMKKKKTGSKQITTRTIIKLLLIRVMDYLMAFLLIQLECLLIIFGWKNGFKI